MIHAGTWTAGEALPSERSLSEGGGVSRITARKAIALLVEQGLIRRVRGAGSFITPRTEDPLSRLTGFTRKDGAARFQAGLRMARSRTACSESRRNRASRIVSGRGRCEPQTTAARRRHRDGGRALHQHSTLPATVVPDPLAIGVSLYSIAIRRSAGCRSCAHCSIFAR